MHTKEKTDRVTWQVTDTTGVPILGRTQAKLMSYISYLEIHAPQQQKSSVSQDSIKSTDHVHTLMTMQHSRQSNPKFDQKFDQLKFGQTVQTAQSMDSLQTKPKLNWKFDWLNLTNRLKFNQTAQEEHRVVTEAKSGTELTTISTVKWNGRDICPDYESITNKGHGRRRRHRLGFTNIQGYTIKP